MKRILSTLTSCIAGVAAMAQVVHHQADFISGSNLGIFGGGPIIAKNSPCYSSNLDTVTLSGRYTGNGKVQLNANKRYLLRGFTYIGDGVRLIIPEGTVIFGEKETNAALIIEQGGVIKARGTVSKPIVFTSCQPAGQRQAGDWGGVIIADKGITSCGSNLILEGGAPGNKTLDPPGYEVVYGGNDGTRNSGNFRFVRIEYPGHALAPDEEINGLTFAAVGNRTTVDHVQVSYSSDDAFEWFGGKVNTSYLISFCNEDDDIDTDYGYRGASIFGLVLRDPNIANGSGSYAFESSSTTCGGRATRPNIANYTVIGPDFCSASGNPNFKFAAQWKKGSEAGIYNSLLTGFPGGIEAKDAADQANFANNAAQFKHNVLSEIGGLGEYSPVTLPAQDGLRKFYPGVGQVVTNQILARADIKFKDGANNGCYPLNANKEFTLKAVSPLRVEQTSTIPGWDTVGNRWQAQSGFVTANPVIKNTISGFKSFDWIDPAGQGKWINWNPQSTVYAPIAPVAYGSEEDLLDVYPTVISSTATVKFVMDTEEAGKVEVYDFSGRVVMDLSHNFTRGFNQFDFNATSLKDGAYLVKVTTSSTVQTERIFIKK